MKTNLPFILTLLILFFGCSEKTDQLPKQGPLKIWFNQPATEWVEALPVGNGSLGGMIYGIPGKEKIVLNEESVWTGQKLLNRDKKDGHKYLKEIQDLLFDGKYTEAEKLANEKLLSERMQSGTQTNQILANLYIESEGLDNVTDYRRELDINNSIVSTTFKNDGADYFREVFSSYPDKVMVIRYGTSKEGGLNFTSWIERTKNTKIELAENSIFFSEHVGNGVGVKLFSQVHFQAIGGTVEAIEGKIQVKNATEVIIRIVAATDYKGGNPEEICLNNFRNALSVDYKKLLRFHLTDYQDLFNRVLFNISDNNGEDLPTDQRLKNVINGATDDYLTQLQYQFGRYLLISSSRPGSMPANLQGIWVDGFEPPWNADYHININIQMNYWLAELTNLTECHIPFLEFIGELREQGRITAKETYGAKGFVAHHTTDAWHMTNCFGNAQYGMWPMGAAWACQHLYTHYEFTEDQDYLREYAYPVMKEAAEFFVDLLVPDPKTGLLLSGPSISPENRFISETGEKATMNMGPTMDKEIIFDLFKNCIAAANILGTDQDFSALLQEKLDKMAPLQIGSDGRLMEWTEEFEEAEPGHRHISHLFALHPSNQITKQFTPDLFDAAKKTIEHRLANGGGHTGWSRAWIINFWARLLEPEKAYENILALQRKSTISNLFDNHPPFQIDGNFGVVSGITEMLLQSHANELHLLPALPIGWPTGSINGIKGRKGFDVNIKWENGILKSASITSLLGNNLNIRYGESVKSFETKAGEIITFDNQLNKIN